MWRPARLQGRLVHLVGGWRGDAEFGGDRGDRALGDAEVHPTIRVEIRADIAVVILPRFLAGQPAQEGCDVVDSQLGLFGDRDKCPPVGSVMVANMLMPDAQEGIAAFLGRRAPVWSDECS